MPIRLVTGGAPSPEGVTSLSSDGGVLRTGAIGLTSGAGVRIDDNGDNTFTFRLAGTSVTSLRAGAGGVHRAGDLALIAGAGIAVTDNADGTFTVATAGGGGASLLTPPPAVANWAWINQTTAAAVDEAANPTLLPFVGAGILLSYGGGATGGVDAKMLARVVPATPWTATIGFIPGLAATNFASAGLMLYDTVSTKARAIAVLSDGTMRLTNYNSPTNFFSNLTFSPGTLVAAPLLFFRVSDNGVTRTWSVSGDGFNFAPVVAEASAAFVQGNRVGPVVDPYNSNAYCSMYFCHWTGA